MVLALQFLVLSVWQMRREPGLPADFSQDDQSGLYAALAVTDVSDAFSAGGGDCFYFLADNDGYLYVAVLSDQQYRSLCDKLDSGASNVTLTGVTQETPTGIRWDACDYFGNIAYTEFLDYFGGSYLDCTRTPFSAAADLLIAGAIACVLLALGTAAFWLRRRVRVGHQLQKLSRAGRLDKALEQLRSVGPEQMAGPLAVTEDYFFDGRMGTLCVRGELRDLELRRGVLGMARLRVRAPHGRQTVARLSKAQRLRLKDLLRPTKTMLIAGNFARPGYWTVPESRTAGEG